MDKPRADLTDYGHEAATDPERAAIGALQQLAKRWPPSLKLISMDGNLHVIHQDDESIVSGFDAAPERQARILADIDGIPNDGGAW